MIVHKALLACGYDALETRADDTDAEARRRYELGLLLQASKTAGSSAKSAETEQKGRQSRK